MRTIRFEHNGQPTFGILEGDLETGTVQPISGAPWEAHQPLGAAIAAGSVKLLPPVMPPTFYAAGLNYVEHIRHVAEGEGKAPNIPTKPDIGYRAVNSLAAHGDDILIPPDAGERVHYEGEVVAVIGRKAKNLSEAEALDCVFGYTIGNDVSERDWQKEDRTFWRAKNCDTWAPMGPWIETNARLEDMQTTVRVNGQTIIEFPTNDMLFGVARYISAMTRYLTLYPGDVIWMGTEGASPNMKAGDVCEISISGIGTLRNTFRAG